MEDSNKSLNRSTHIKSLIMVKESLHFTRVTVTLQKKKMLLGTKGNLYAKIFLGGNMNEYNTMIHLKQT